MPPTQRFLPVLLLLFVGSGCAALIYEIVWFQLIQLVIGSSAVSLGVLLGTFMGGMCLGSLFFRDSSHRQHPLRVYAVLEAGIGGARALGARGRSARRRCVYVDERPRTRRHSAARFVCAICLLPPTLLMGATLPAIARWVETTPTGVSWLGFFYGSNIAGAVFGCLLAGFYLLRVHDMATTTVVAVVINYRRRGRRVRAVEARTASTSGATSRATARRSRSASRGPISSMSRSPCPAFQRSAPRSSGRDCCR